MSNKIIDRAKEHVGRLLEQQLDRIERIKTGEKVTDYSQIQPIIIGIIGGDGIGPYIANEAQRVLEDLLANELNSGKVEFRIIEGLTIEKRAEVNKPIPEDILEEIKQCHVTLKGPTTTPRKG
ncbi:MAG TPA: isocitrate dehydrogenase, partial [Muricauda sp.]|nr:isocitrate dehydrogenase [Allomuricauda sp.]